MRIKSIRTQAAMQIGPHGSSLDVERTGCTLELRPDLGCVLAKGMFNGTKYREVLIPLSLCVHIELEPSVVVPALDRPPAQTASGKLVVPEAPPPTSTAEVKPPEPEKTAAKEPFKAPKKY